MSQHLLDISIHTSNIIQCNVLKEEENVLFLMTTTINKHKLFFSDHVQDFRSTHY